VVCHHVLSLSSSIFSLSLVKKYEKRFCIYANLLLTNHRVNHAKTHVNNQIARIIAVFLKLNQEYHTIIRAVAQIMSIVQKSGINKNIAYRRALKTINNRKN
jgi:hypothetical protein